MKRDEAVAQYLITKEEYAKACLACETDRKTNRDWCFKSYNALKLAEIDLIDICFDKVESKLNKQGQYNDLLNEIINTPVLRQKAAEISLLLK